MRASVLAWIEGTPGWRVVDATSTSPRTAQRRVELEIQGDEHFGYHLVMCPEGCTFADTWHATLEDAKESAREMFGVPLDGWTV
jgi:hypothetical protein